MPTTIKLKNSVTTTNAPSSLVQGEVAINVTDKKVWVGNAATTPIQLLGTGATGNFSALTCTTLTASGVATFSAGTVSAPAITTTGDTNTGIFFPAADTIAFTEGGVESMRITSTGNVGIGTSSPSYKVDVNGRTRSSDFGMTNSTQNYYHFDNFTGNNFMGLPSTSTLGIYIAGAERMRITSGGNLLVNSTVGTLPLSVQGTNGGAAAGMFTGAAAGVGNDLIYFYSSGQAALIGYIGYNGTLVTYNTTSDYRLKDNIVPMTGALAKVAQLKPVTYTWKLNNANGQGFIAHELAEVFPDAVSGEKDGMFKDGKIKPQGIDTSILVATLTAAIQELKAEFDAYKATHP